MIKGKRVFLTGGAGFIGTALARRLVTSNKVVVYDNLHRNAMRFSGLKGHPHFTFIKGDVLDARKLRRAMRGATHVLHMASIAGVDTVLSMPVKTMEVALLGTYNALQAALDLPRLERFVDFSTSEVFGSFAYNVEEKDSTTLGTVGEARWTYAVSKLATEHLAMTYHRQEGFPAVSVRPFNIFGPMQVGLGAVHSFIVRALKGEPLLIHNEGSQIRSWCYIDDMVEGVLLCLSRRSAVGHAFNIGNTRNTLTIYHLAQMIKNLSGSQSTIRFVRKKIIDVDLRIPNTDKARRLLGYEAKVDLDSGLRRTIDWYRALK